MWSERRPEHFRPISYCSHNKPSTIARLEAKALTQGEQTMGHTMVQTLCVHFTLQMCPEFPCHPNALSHTRGRDSRPTEDVGHVRDSGAQRRAQPKVGYLGRKEAAAGRCGGVTPAI